MGNFMGIVVTYVVVFGGFTIIYNLCSYGMAYLEGRSEQWMKDNQ